MYPKRRGDPVVRGRTRKQRQTRLRDEEVDALVAGYQGGLTLDELASAFSVDPATAASHLERRGVKRRGRKLTDDQAMRQRPSTKLAGH